MLETTTSIELQHLTQHLVRQPSARAVVAEFIHQMRMSSIPIAFPAELPGDVAPDRLDTTQPLIVHLPGASNRAVLIGVGADRPSPPLDDFGLPMRLSPLFVGDHIAQELDEYGMPRSIFGRGALTTAAPLAIAWWLVRELRQLGDDLPGHVLLAVAPNTATGGAAFERAGTRLTEYMHQHRLKPILALVPGRLRPGAAPKKKSIVLSTGSAGVMTVQLFVAGETASPTSRFRMFDPVALIAALIQRITMAVEPLGDDEFSVPPPTAGRIDSGPPPAPGWAPTWAAARLSVFADNPDPAELFKHLLAVCAESFETHIGRLAAQYSRQRRFGPSDRKPASALAWQPAVYTFRELRRTCRYELPPIVPAPDSADELTALAWAQDQALRRVRFAYEHSPYAGKPIVVLSFVPPVLPPFRMDPEDTLAFPVLKRTAKDYNALRTTAGLFGDAWQRLALAAWSAKCARFAHDESPLGNEPHGFGLRTEWGNWPLVGFGPVGKDAGTRSECVDVDPSFTHLPECLRTLIVRALALEDRPTIGESVWSRMRKWSNRIGLTKRHEIRDDDDHILFPDDALDLPPQSPQSPQSPPPPPAPLSPTSDE